MSVLVSTKVNILTPKTSLSGLDITASCLSVTEVAVCTNMSLNHALGKARATAEQGQIKAETSSSPGCTPLPPPSPLPPEVSIRVLRESLRVLRIRLPVM